jgi:hypothetical protein
MAWTLAMLLALSPLAAAELEPQEGYTLIRLLMSEKKKERREAAEELIAAGDVSLVPAIVDAFFYTPRLLRPDMSKVLEALTGEEHGSYYGWVEYVGRSEIEPKERYIEWKALLLQQKDAQYAKIFYPGAPARIRLEEIISGGVPLDGIPSLDNPPVTLSYCTLCGSGILYSGRTQSGARTFGTSGLLYRSNKLMYDRQSYTLWSNITGEAVVGRLATGESRLETLPVTVTTWGEWLARHPDTEVLDLKAVQRSLAHLPYRFSYLPGAADRARRGVEFPVWQKSDLLPRDSEIFALQINGAAKAYPLDVLERERVVNDELGGEELVLVVHPDSGAVRAYARGGRSYRRGDSPDELIDEHGNRWSVTELALESGDGHDSLPRLAQGHIAYWFGWVGFYPQTAVYRD